MPLSRKIPKDGPRESIPAWGRTLGSWWEGFCPAACCMMFFQTYSERKESITMLLCSLRLVWQQSPRQYTFSLRAGANGCLRGSIPEICIKSFTKIYPLGARAAEKFYLRKSLLYL